MTEEPEVLVLGGGPAGSAAAGLLAKWGYEVVVVERRADGRTARGGRRSGAVGRGDAAGGSRPGGPGGRSLAESLPPSTRRVLAATGLLGVVEAGGFQANGGNTALWGGEGRRDDFAGGATGFHVLRSRFDRLLRDAAAMAGAEVVRGVARSPRRVGEAGGWGVEVVGDGGERATMRPGWLLDCTGRTGLLGRRHRVLETAAPTLAVIRCYENAAGWTNVDPTHALVESFGRGWAWSVPTTERERHVAVMLDPELHAVVEGAGDLTAAFEAEVARTSLMRSIADAGRPAGRAWAATASMYASSSFADGRALLVGDAASFVDPMSSYGVKKALASGWLAAVAVNTAMRAPEMAGTAVEFFARRERAMYRAMRGGLAPQVAGAGSGEGGGPFWERRVEWLADHAGSAADPNAPDGPDAAALRDDPEMRAAFHALRLGSGRLRTGRRETVDRPLVIDNRIRLAPALVTPRFPGGVRHFRDVDLLRVAHLAPASRNPGALYESYSEWAAREDLPPVDLANFIGVVALLVADGVLAPGEGSRSTPGASA